MVARFFSTPDAGIHGGVSVDAGATTSPPSDEGCGCSAVGSRGGDVGAWWCLAALAAWVSRRRHR
ncbi:MAG: MYXO-CTERM sorting domain-containing protein [Polyangiales bacterium]